MKKLLIMIFVLALFAGAVSAQVGNMGRRSRSAASAKAKITAVDPRIVGTWKRVGTNHLLKFDANNQQYFGIENVPYELQNAGNTLVINNISTYQRIGPSTASIVGHWRDDANGEEFYYRAEGRYIALDDGELLVYFGTYSVSNSTFTGFDYRTAYDTVSGNLIQYVHGFPGEHTTPYTITENDTKLTLTVNGSPIVYVKQ